MVTNPKARAATRKGIFSSKRGMNRALGVEEPGCSPLTRVGSRPSGHQSSKSITRGSVTSMLLLIKLQRKNINESRYKCEARRPGLGGFAFPPSLLPRTFCDFEPSPGLESPRAATYLTYINSDPSPKKVLNKSFRSAAHATDSTCSG